MRYSKSLPIIILFIILGFYTHPQSIEAACNFHALMTDASKDVSNFTSTCTITAIEGVDNPQNVEGSIINNASLTLGTDSAITINNGGTLAVNSISILAGSISMQTGGQILLNTPLYIADADADGYPTDFTLYTASASGRRRLGLMRNFTTVDCGDASYSTVNSCCTVATRYQDADGDGYGNPSVSISACTTAGYVDNASDCNEDSALVFTSHAQCYTDADGDGYTTGLAANTTCLNTSSCATATKASASTNGAAVTTYIAGRLANAANGSDCNDTGTDSANVYVAATCYADADNDNYGTGAAKSCTNNATCGTATWASGGAGTAAASGTFSANATDCNDTGANSANVWVAATCYVDLDNDNYGSATSRSCTNHATCGSATWASVGTGAAAAGTFSAVNTDCYDADAATTNAELAYPGSTTCSTVARTNGGYDFNCSGTNTACGTAYYGTSILYYYYRDLSCGGTEEGRCCPNQASVTVSTSVAVGCGVTGRTMGVLSYYGSGSCEADGRTRSGISVGASAIKQGCK